MDREDNQSQTVDLEAQDQPQPPLLEYREKPLSARERKYYGFLQVQHAEGLPWHRFFARSWWRIVLLIVYAAIIGALVGFNSWLFAFVAGACFGMTINGAAIWRLARRNWPMIESVIDWPRVDRLVATDAEAKKSLG